MTPEERTERRHVDDKPPDFRSAFQRDRDRIMYSSAFRRLGGVTQVVLAREGHLFHNRLTHSIKVAQVGRRIAEKLSQNAEQARAEAGEPDPDVVEAAALAHDLGHPPFGHVAEQALDRLVRDAGVPDGFEGNAQSFRILTKLSLVLDNIQGLNLTRATLNAVLKYPWLRADTDRKWGAYRSEQGVLEWARGATGLSGRTRTLEAEIMDWADDITYAVHDVEDFFRSGFIPLESLSAGGDEPTLDTLRDRMSQRWDTVLNGDLGERDIVEAAAATLDIFPLRHAYGGTRGDRAALRNFTATLIGRYVNATELSYAGLEVRKEARVQVALLKELTQQFVIENPALATQQYGQRQIVEDLFRVYHEAFQQRDSAVFPPRLREEIQEAMEEGDDASGTRLIADSIAGMTEDQALEVRGRLTGADFGSVTDPTLL